MKSLRRIILIAVWVLVAYQGAPYPNFEPRQDDPIVQIPTALFQGADGKDWHKARNAMGDRVMLDYSSLSGNPAVLLPPDQIVESWQRFLPSFDRTHRQFFEFTITQNGDTPIIHCRGKADHFIGEDRGILEGTYDGQLARDRKNWLVNRLQSTPITQVGDVSLPERALESVKNKPSIIMERVTFKSDGLSLVGNLYKPQDFDSNKKYPAVVTGGSLTSVKEQMAGTYAQKLAEKGIVALAFDYRNYGESEGQPRQYEDPALKLRDLESAVSYLASQSYVQAVGALGVCTSGGNVAYLAADDKRLKAFATVAAWLPDAAALPLLYGSQSNVDALRKSGEEAKRDYETTGNNKLILAYSNVDKTASHVGPMEYYMDKTRGGGVKEWKNEFAVASWPTWFDFDPISKAPLITAPYMMVHSDGCALPQNAKKFFEAIPGKKELVWGDGYHFDYYDQPKQVNAAVEKVSQFFIANLK